jgi:DNA-binding transcriptional ArsR family regulator
VAVATIDDLDVLGVLGHPTRVALLEHLHDPASAASVARELGQPRQSVNYHLKELDRAGLVRVVGERRRGNFVETLYQAVARSFTVSPRIAWSHPDRVDALRRQHPLEALVQLGERLQVDAAALLDRAAFAGEEIASAAVTAEVRFASPEDRAAFMDAYLRSTRELLERFGGAEGAPFRAVLAVYPRGGER